MTEGSLLKISLIQCKPASSSWVGFLLYALWRFITKQIPSFRSFLLRCAFSHYTTISIPFHALLAWRALYSDDWYWPNTTPCSILPSSSPWRFKFAPFTLFYFYFMCVGVLPVWMSVLTFTVGPGPIKPSHERFHIGLYLEWCCLPERGCREQASLNILLATALSQHLCPATSPVILHSLLRASCKSRALTLHGSLFLHDASNFMKNLYSVHTFQAAGS